MEILTKLVQCSCGNYFNAANHTSCPICGAAASAQNVEDPGFGPTMDPVNAGQNMGGFGKTVAVGQASASPNLGNFGKTVDPRMNGQSGGVNMTQPVFQDHKGGNQNPGFAHTMNVYNIQGEGQEQSNVQPVVGWLVCVKGPMLGNDYRIHAGYNSIGREIGDIHIRGDQTISREKHARIAFEHKSSRFFFGPDEGRNIVYVNGEMVMNSMELHAYDVITIGNTELLFVPLCGEHFSWNG